MPSSDYSEVIGAARDLIPNDIHGLILPHYLCGVDPLFVGLHNYQDTDDGRSYRETLHVAYDFHQVGLARSHRRTTVVLPHKPVLEHLVHELGHVLDENLGFRHAPDPVSEYAHTNRYESFAEAFTSWIIPGYAARPDQGTVACFERLLLT